MFPTKGETDALATPAVPTTPAVSETKTQCSFKLYSRRNNWSANGIVDCVSFDPSSTKPFALNLSESQERTLGSFRGRTNIRLPETFKLVSRHHASFVATDKQLYLFERKAKYGTKLDGKTLEPDTFYLLNEGSHVTLAPSCKAYGKTFDFEVEKIKFDKVPVTSSMPTAQSIPITPSATTAQAKSDSEVSQGTSGDASPIVIDSDEEGEDSGDQSDLEVIDCGFVLFENDVCEEEDDGLNLYLEEVEQEEDGEDEEEGEEDGEEEDEEEEDEEDEEDEDDEDEEIVIGRNKTAVCTLDLKKLGADRHVEYDEGINQWCYQRDRTSDVNDSNVRSYGRDDVDIGKPFAFNGNLGHGLHPRESTVEASKPDDIQSSAAQNVFHSASDSSSGALGANSRLRLFQRPSSIPKPVEEDIDELVAKAHEETNGSPEHTEGSSHQESAGDSINAAGAVDKPTEVTTEVAAEKITEVTAENTTETTSDKPAEATSDKPTETSLIEELTEELAKASTEQEPAATASVQIATLSTTPPLEPTATFALKEPVVTYTVSQPQPTAAFDELASTPRSRKRTREELEDGEDRGVDIPQPKKSSGGRGIGRIFTAVAAGMLVGSIGTVTALASMST